jgi:hypothetical protein
MSRHIAALDRSLARAGEPVTIIRITGTNQQLPTAVDCLAHVRLEGDQSTVGNVMQRRWSVIISPTEITAAQWPGGQAVGNPPVQTDPRLPRKGDKISIGGKSMAIERADPVRVNGEVVRINIEAVG